MTLIDYMHIHGPSADERVIYGRATSQYLEYFRPVGQGPYPVIVIVQGGCWMRKYAGMRQVAGMARRFANEGYAVYSVEYRGIDEAGGGYLGTYEDLASALDAIGRLVKRHRLDLTELVGIGHSQARNFFFGRRDEKTFQTIARSSILSPSSFEQ